MTLPGDFNAEEFLGVLVLKAFWCFSCVACFLRFFAGVCPFLAGALRQFAGVSCF